MADYKKHLAVSFLWFYQNCEKVDTFIGLLTVIVGLALLIISPQNPYSFWLLLLGVASIIIGKFKLTEKILSAFLFKHNNKRPLR